MLKEGSGNAVSLPIIGIILMAVVCNPHASWWYGSFSQKESGLNTILADSVAAMRDQQVIDLQEQYGSSDLSVGSGFLKRKYGASQASSS